MQSSILTSYVLPLALFLIMLGMGLSLVIDDFKRVIERPKAIGVGLLSQMIVLPFIGYLVVVLFGLPPELGFGLIILALCPGGTTSNMYSFLAKGDVALSVSLTAVVSVLTPFTIPLVAAFIQNSLVGTTSTFELPILKTIIQLLIITALPIAIGMWIRTRWPNFATRSQTGVKAFSIVFLFLIIAAVVMKIKDDLPSFFAQVGLAALTLNIFSMAAGFSIAKLGQLSTQQVKTISIEVGIQNGTTALLITTTLIANPVMGIAPAVYSLLMFATGSIFAAWAARWGNTENSG